MVPSLAPALMPSRFMLGLVARAYLECRCKSAMRCMLGTIVGNGINCTSNNGSYGLALTVSDYTIVGNTINGCAPGLDLFSTSASNNVQSNILNTDTTPITDAGTGDVIANNIGYNPVGTTAAASTGTSGSTITAGASPETHYIKQSANFNAAVAKNSQAICTVATAAVPCVVQLGPHESYVVTWSTTQPNYTKDVH